MEEYDELRADHYASLESRVYLTLPEAQKHRNKIDFVANPPAPR
jgi:hypothetical protein